MTTKHIFLKGTYWVGDPCYVVKDENWLPLLEETAYFGLPDHKPTGFFNDGLFHYNGENCFATGTAYGDGSYRLLGKYSVDTGIYIPVDAGLISIMPVCALDEQGAGATLVFEEDFMVWEHRGVFHFGDYKINTNY